jgi:hypothetical protein
MSTENQQHAAEHAAWMKWAEYVSKLKCRLIADFRRQNYGKIHPDELHQKSNDYADAVVKNDSYATELYQEWQSVIKPISTHTPPLTGTLTFAGDMNVNDEEISGVMLDIDRANLIAAKALPMYQRCVVMTEEEYQKLTKPNKLSMQIRLERNDAMPAFGAFLRCEAEHAESPVIFLNVEACMSLDDASTEEIKRNIITTLMHEFGHAMESYFRLPDNEEAIDTAIDDWMQTIAKVYNTSPQPRYAQFGKAMWQYIEKIGGEFCGEEISEDILPLAQAAGLCHRVKYDPAIHGSNIDADPGDEIWYWGNATTEQPTPETTCLLEVEISESRRRYLTIEVPQSLADRICEWTLKYNPTAAEEQAAFEAVKSAKIIKEEIIHDTYEIGSVDFPNATASVVN